MLDLARDRGEPIDVKRLLAAIQRAAKGRASPDRKKRLMALIEAVSGR